MAGEAPGVMNAKAIVFLIGIQWPFLFYLAFSPRMCYHMEKHYISGMSDSKAASARIHYSVTFRKISMLLIPY